MLSKPIPRWVLAGAFALSATAGCVNAIGFLSMQQRAFSHMSGHATNAAVEMGSGNFAAAGRTTLVLLCFFLGCVLSGIIIRHSTLKAGRRYGVALIGESILLFTSAYLLLHGAIAGDFFAAAACGLQNAMATSYSGAVIRTTHVTGIVTDLGIAVGLAARREPVDLRRIGLYSILLGGFIVGGVLGAMGFARFSYGTLCFPAAFVGLAGLVHTALLQFRRPEEA